MQVQGCKMLGDMVDYALKRPGDLQPLAGMVQPMLAALAQCFQQEATHLQALQPPGSQTSAQLAALAGVIDQITTKVAPGRAQTARGQAVKLGLQALVITGGQRAKPGT